MSDKLKVEMIVAVATNGVIGKNGKMPWHLPTDLKRFKQITMGHAVVMGRKTYESIGRALPHRHNIVLSSQILNMPQGVDCVATPEAALQAARVKNASRAMIIGGQQIYKIFEPQAQILHLTRVHAQPDGDTHFALDAPNDWHEIAHEKIPASEKDTADMSFITLARTG